MDFRRSHVSIAILSALALLAGTFIGWMDSRPGWDDTGITAGLLFLAAGSCAALGLRWYLAAVLVAAPLLLLEFRTLGIAALLVLGVALVGAVVGATVRRFLAMGARRAE